MTSFNKTVGGVVISTATLGLGFNSVINTIAGVRLDFDNNAVWDHFEVNLDVADGVKNYGLNLDRASVTHWKERYSKEEISRLTSNPVPYAEGFEQFVAWFKMEKNHKVWFHSGHFHSPIIKTSMQAVYGKDADPLWYNNVCDANTLQSVFGDAPADIGNHPMDKVLANAAYIMDFFNSLKD